jgi:hypothetical protein
MLSTCVRYNGKSLERTQAGDPMRILVVLLAALLILTTSFATQDEAQTARKELEPRTVTFSKSALPLQQALAELAAQTGNTVADLRRQKANPTIALPAQPTAFWPALDAIAKASGIGYSPYLAEAGVGLSDAPYRAVTTAHTGIFRIAVRGIDVRREEETQAHHCQLALDVAWEPRFRPFYVDLRQVRLTFAADAQKKTFKDTVAARSPVPVAGRTAVEIDVLSAAPHRSCPAIAAVDGAVWAVGPSKMLSFRFSKLAVQKAGAKGPAAPPATQEGVTVTLGSIRRQADALLVTVEIENPKGGPSFETHQSWLDNNRMILSRGEGGKKRTLNTTVSRDEMRGNGAKVVYVFGETADQRIPDSLEGWTLEYETPGRMVEVTAPFTLKNLALP